MTGVPLPGFFEEADVTTTGREYHRHTSYDRHRMSGHFLDWSNQPDVYKRYPGLPETVLPAECSLPQDGLSTVIDTSWEREPPSQTTKEDLTRVIRLAYALTARARHSGGDFHYRSVPSAGALYPFELYMATREVEGVEDGLYHYSIAHHSLARLRKGSFHHAGQGIPPSSSSSRPATLVFYLTAIFFRSAWKYRDRSFRYHLMDTGHLVENLALALKACRLPHEVLYDFDDGEVNRFLGVDADREVCLAQVKVPGSGTVSAAQAPDLEELPPSIQEASRVSPKEIEYPLLKDVYATGSPRGSQTAAGAAGSVPVPEALGFSPTASTPLPEPASRPEVMSYADAVLRRRSLRNFVSRTLSAAQWQTLLRTIASPLSSGSPVHEESAAAGFLSGRSLEGLEAGCYWLDRQGASLAISRKGAFLDSMARICLDQSWLAQCGLHLFLAANLQELENRWGPRGYRYAMLTAGRLGQRAYLGATALGLGCCGIGAFYDGEASSLLGLNDPSAMLYLLGIGPVKKVF